MAIQCPYCQHSISVKSLKPGKFAPKCPKCSKAFHLTVADDAQNTMTVAAIAGNLEPTVPSTSARKPASETPKTSEAPEPPPAPEISQTIAAPKSKPPAQAPAAAPPKRSPSVDATVARPATRPPVPGGEPKSSSSSSAADVTAPPVRRKSAVPQPVANSGADVTTPPRSSSRVSSATDATAAPSLAMPRSGSSGGSASGGSGGGGGASAATMAPPLNEQGDADILTGTLGGYALVKRLGQGGMGAVYLARQISLDRNVAVKTMNPEWANDPNFVARFTREAYAAAQLNHHNVVQIYDIGAEQSTNFFSMEFVDGRSLGDLLKEKGQIDCEEAAGYILQAARGLKFAHDQGMVHRDIKPDNLMINKQGIVKVADLGLVKTPASVAAEDEAARVPQGTASGTGSSPTPTPAPGIATPGSGKSPGSGLLSRSAASSATRVDVAMGTPAYMPPEQGKNAAGVDQRADIYSLGCTLYVLVTGRPVFEGATAVEVMSKHATEQMTPPELIVERIPKALSGIIQKMTAKLPKDRYQTMDEVIKVLEDFLGIASAGPFTPKEEHARTLEEGVKVFNASKPAQQRRWIIMGFYGLCALVAIGLVLTKSLTAVWWAGGILGLALLATLCYQVIIGITEKTFLFAKARQWIFGADWKDWLKAVGVDPAGGGAEDFQPAVDLAGLFHRRGRAGGGAGAGDRSQGRQGSPAAHRPDRGDAQEHALARARRAGLAAIRVQVQRR